jgi:hypothetical protein
MKKQTEVTKAIDIAITKEDLVRRVEGLVRKDGLGYIEAVIDVCASLDIEPEDISKLVTGPLRTRIEIEAQKRCLLPTLGDTAVLV